MSDDRNRLVLWLITMAMLLPATRRALGETRVKKDIEFAVVDGHSLKLDLYFAESSDAPLVVWIHGGGWRSGSKAKCMVSWLAERGFTVASISYRLTDKAIFPAQIHDCKAAVRWLRANAGRYGYSTRKIAVGGSSAGGHLATLLGTTSGVDELEGDVGGNSGQSSAVNAIVDFYGPTDFIQRTRTQPHKTIEEGSPVRLLLGGPGNEKVELARLASPAFHVTSDDPPLLIFHGSKDNKVLMGQSERIVNAYREAGLPVTLHVVDGAGHGGPEFFQGENRTRVVEFLKAHIHGE